MSESIFSGKYLISYLTGDGIEIKRYLTNHIEGFKGTFIVFADAEDGKRVMLSGNIIIEEQ